METLLTLAQPVLGPLLRSGYSSYLVGGAVRDTLMGRPVHDLDVATAALPQQVMEIFSGHTILETGLRHGTVTLITESGPVEITTFRTEGDYSDHRRPDQVFFTAELTEDLMRRDFTINAIALGQEGLVDLFGGQADIQSRIIRCVGDPYRRFEEDALRILRGLRMAACLEFSIEENTAQAMLACAPSLNHIARERVSQELVRLICGPGAEEILLKFPQIITTILPELAPAIGFDQKTPYHQYDVYTHSVKVLSAVPPTEVLRLAALLHDVAKPATFSRDRAGVGHFFHHSSRGAAMAEDILRRLRFDKSTCHRVAELIRFHAKIPRIRREQELRALLAKTGPSLFFPLIELGRGDNLAKTPKAALPQQYWGKLSRQAVKLLDSGFCLSVESLAISGEDALQAGLHGPAVGHALRAILLDVQMGKLPNQRNSLLAALARFC